MPVETTLYSISSEPPPVESRRSSERHLTIFRVGSIFIDGVRELCLVKNISAGGALIRAYCSLEVGQELMIEIKEGNPVPGRVSWLRENDSGIEFDSPIDVVDLLTAGSEGRRPRMPRLETNCIGLIRDGSVVTIKPNARGDGLVMEAKVDPAAAAVAEHDAKQHKQAGAEPKEDKLLRAVEDAIDPPKL